MGRFEEMMVVSLEESQIVTLFVLVFGRNSNLVVRRLFVVVTLWGSGGQHCRFHAGLRIV